MQLPDPFSKEGEGGCWGSERAGGCTQEIRLSSSAGHHKGNHLERLKKGKSF